MTALEQSAMEYGAAVAALQSATECGMPSDLLNTLEFNMMTARAELLNEAIDLHKSIYDGVTE